MITRRAPEVRGDSRRRKASGRALLGNGILLSLLVGFSAAAQSGESPLEAWAGGTPASAAAPTLDGNRLAVGPRAKVTLVHFFATWCEPCRAEMASLAGLAGRHPPADLAILGVDVGEVPARVRRFFEGGAPPFPILIDEERAIAKAWGVRVLPTTVVLDRDGNARFAVRRDLDWLMPEVGGLIAALIAAPETAAPETAAPETAAPDARRLAAPTDPTTQAGPETKP